MKEPVNVKEYMIALEWGNLDIVEYSQSVLVKPVGATGLVDNQVVLWFNKLLRRR
jgi:hypothetical protein